MVQASPKQKSCNNTQDRSCTGCSCRINADLAEYHNLGGSPGHELSYMIERSDAYLLEHDALLRELVDARRAQLRLWLDAPESKLARKHSRRRKAAKDCMLDISEL